MKRLDIYIDESVFDYCRKRGTINATMNTDLRKLVLQRIEGEGLKAFSCYDFTDLASYKTISKVPAPISTQPMIDFVVTCSCRKTKASISVITTLSLSIGTTFDASPICSAL